MAARASGKKTKSASKATKKSSAKKGSAKKSTKKPGAKKTSARAGAKGTKKKAAPRKSTTAKAPVKAAPAGSGMLVHTRLVGISKRLLGPSTTSGGQSASGGISYTNPARSAMLRRLLG